VAAAHLPADIRDTLAFRHGPDHVTRERLSQGRFQLHFGRFALRLSRAPVDAALHVFRLLPERRQLPVVLGQLVDPS
jgi:hypothetical protein